MTIEIEYDESIDCMVIIATDLIEYSAMPQLAEDLIKHQKFRKDINQLFDCSNGELSLTTDELYKIADDISQIGHILGVERKLAIVASRDADFGRMRQYEVFFQAGPGVKVHVFRSLIEAREWLIT